VGDAEVSIESRADTWLINYKRAWEQQDPDLVATLFTVGARYAVNPLENVIVGRDAIKRYWSTGASGSQRDITFDYEIWSVTEEMTIVHWVASFLRFRTKEQVKMDGVFRLVFENVNDATLTCSALEEWWFSAVQEK